MPAKLASKSMTTTNTMYDICAHISLPTSAIIAPGLLKKKEDDEQFSHEQR